LRTAATPSFLRAHSEGLNFGQIALIYALETFVYAGLSYPFGTLSDRFGRIRMLAIAWVLYALVYLGLAMVTGGWIWGLFALYGVYLAINDGVSKALISDVAPKEAKGRAMGTFYMVTGFATLLGSLSAGILWDHVSHAAPFFLGAALAVLAVLAVPLARRPMASPSNP
jgi:MFS family permease